MRSANTASTNTTLSAASRVSHTTLARGDQEEETSGLRLPTDADTTLEDTKVDLVYDQVSPPAAIIFEDGHTHRDTTGLVFAGYNPIVISAADDLWDVIVRNPAVFGVPSTKPEPPHADHGAAR